MCKRLTIVAYLGNEALHANQFFTGLGMLNHNGLITAILKRASNQIQGKCYIECLIEDKKVIFEFHDRAGYVEKDKYEWCDFYVKRSVTQEMVTQYPKIIPWGLNFYITSVHDFAFRRSLLKPTLRAAISNYLMSSSRFSKILNSAKLSEILKIKHAAYTARFENFQQKPFMAKHPVIVFSPQLWDPERVADDKRKEDRLRLNNQRIDFVKALKKYFPSLYAGGVEDSALARKICPDLILSSKSTHKINYIKGLTKASIGISTPGLVDSISWKFGEYLLFSKAIVSNDLSHHILHASVYCGVNYSMYSSTETMLHRVEELISDKEFRFYVMNNNYEYAQNFLRPDKQLCLALQKIGFNIEVE